MTARSRRDLVTNPAYEQVMGEMQDVIFTETERLKLDSRESDLGKIQFQSGVVEGVSRALARMKSFRAAALEDIKDPAYA